jgi:2-iminobutanoate/2-iminopropanoate deaminase
MIAEDTVLQEGRSNVERHFFKPQTSRPLPFSSAVQVNDTFYVSGHLGIDPKTGKPPADVDEEITLLLDNFRRTVERCGMTMDDLVMVQVFCSDVSLFDRFNAKYVTYFTGELPARAFLGSGPLLFGARFEILGTAVKR